MLEEGRIRYETQGPAAASATPDTLGATVAAPTPRHVPGGASSGRSRRGLARTGGAAAGTRRYDDDVRCRPVRPAPRAPAQSPGVRRRPFCRPPPAPCGSGWRSAWPRAPSSPFAPMRPQRRRSRSRPCPTGPTWWRGRRARAGDGPARRTPVRVELNGRDVTRAFAIRRNGEYRDARRAASRRQHGGRPGTGGAPPPASPTTRCKGRSSRARRSSPGTACPARSTPSAAARSPTPTSTCPRSRASSRRTTRRARRSTSRRPPPTRAGPSRTSCASRPATCDRGQYRSQSCTTASSRSRRWTGPSGVEPQGLRVVRRGLLHGAHRGRRAGRACRTSRCPRASRSCRRRCRTTPWSCNIAVQAESIMMAKEHLVETYGDVRYLFGYGCSGGSIASLQMANAYPGLIRRAHRLLHDAGRPDARPARLRRRCCATSRARPRGSPASCGRDPAGGRHRHAEHVGLPHVGRRPYHYPEMFQPQDRRSGATSRTGSPRRSTTRSTNPRGLRCSLQDYMSNVFGFRPKRVWGPVEKKIGRGLRGPAVRQRRRPVRPACAAGRAASRRPSSSTSTPRSASIDIDYDPQPRRVAADPARIAAAYRCGFVNEGNHLDKVADHRHSRLLPG